MKHLLMLLVMAICSTAVFAQADKQSKKQQDDSATAKITYTCPSHPDMVSSKQGICPKCGTKLVVQRRGTKQSQTVTYICPMDADVVSDKPGKCPKCGMDLEKQKSSKDQQ